MNLLETSVFSIEIPTSSGTYIIHEVSRSGAAFELVIEEPNGKSGSYHREGEGGKLTPWGREIAGYKRCVVGDLPGVCYAPVYEDASQEVEQVATAAIEAFLLWERRGQVDQL